MKKVFTPQQKAAVALDAIKGKSQMTLVTDDENIAPWLQFFVNICLLQARNAMKLLSKENIESLLSPKQLAVWEYLQNSGEAAPGTIAKATDIARPTVSQALFVLMRLKKIQRLGQGRSTRYKKT